MGPMDIEPEGSKTRETCLPLPSPMFVGASTPAEVDHQRYVLDRKGVIQVELTYISFESHHDTMRSNGNNEYHSADSDHISFPSLPARRDLGYSHGWASSDVQLDDRGDQDHGAPPDGDDGINPSPIRRGRSRVENGSHENSTSSQTTFEAQVADDESVAKSKKKGKSSVEVKVPLIVRQLDAHNESPVSEPETPFNFDDDEGRVRMTRNVRKSLNKLAKNEEVPPARTQNLRSLMKDQFNANRDKKVYFSEGSSGFATPAPDALGKQEVRKPSNGNELANDPHGSRGCLRQELMSKYMRKRDTSFVSMPMANNRLIQDIGAENACRDWANQKQRINELLAQPQYGLRPLKQGSRDAKTAKGTPKTPGYFPTRATPEDNYHMDSGVYVFTPSPTDFMDFGNFLKMVEELVGREVGVVKVVVPRERVSLNPARHGQDSGPQTAPQEQTLSISKVEMRMEEKSKASMNPLFRVFTVPAVARAMSSLPGAWLSTIETSRAKIIKQRGWQGSYRGYDVWKGYWATKPYTEKRMFRHCAEAHRPLYCVSGQPATQEVRNALQCNDPDLQNYFGNRFISSPSTRSGINEPVFHLSAHSGTMFAMQLGKYAVCTLNYHHSGEPMNYTVIKPKDHEKLEDLIGNATHEHLSTRPPKTPSCSQFVRHQAMYLPEDTLQLQDIEYTTVIQYQGEMVIVFPYAYHQGFNAGANITEEIMYASDRWEVFHREKLYQHCSRNCPAKEDDTFNMDFANQGLLSLRSGLRRCSSRESFSPLSQESGDSPVASQEEEEISSSYPRRKTRAAGLRAMDRVSNGEGKYLPRDDASGRCPVLMRKSKRQSAGKKKTDMWSVDSILSDFDDEGMAPITCPKRSRDSSPEDFECFARPSGGRKRRRTSS